MKFLNAGQRVQATVGKVKASGRNSDKREVSIEFSVLVGLAETQAMPAFLKDAWSSMRKSGSHASVIELDGKIESQNVSFYRLEKDKQADLEIGDADLESLRLEKLGNHIFLYFTIKEMLGKALWDWCWYAFLRSVYVEFEECQTELISGKAIIKGAMDALAEEMGAMPEGKDDLTVTLSSPGLGSVTTTTKGLKRAAAKMKSRPATAGSWA